MCFVNNLKTHSKISSYSKNLHRFFCSVPASKIGGGKKTHYYLFFQNGFVFPSNTASHLSLFSATSNHFILSMH